MRFYQFSAYSSIRRSISVSPPIHPPIQRTFDLTTDVTGQSEDQPLGDYSPLSIRANGWEFIRVVIKRHDTVVLSALLMACILKSGSKYAKRRGSGSLSSNVFTGMAGQLAVHTWLRHGGNKAYMTPIHPFPDEGYDIVVGEELFIEVKTGLLNDGRSAATLRHGDALRMIFPKPGKEPDVYLWCLLDPPSLSPQSEFITVYLVAAVPCRSAETKIPGEWSHLWDSVGWSLRSSRSKASMECKLRFEDIKELELSPTQFMESLLSEKSNVVKHRQDVPCVNVGVVGDVERVATSLELFSEVGQSIVATTLSDKGIVQLAETLLSRETIFQISPKTHDVASRVMEWRSRNTSFSEKRKT